MVDISNMLSNLTKHGYFCLINFHNTVPSICLQTGLCHYVGYRCPGTKMHQTIGSHVLYYLICMSLFEQLYATEVVRLILLAVSFFSGRDKSAINSK